MKRTMLGLLTAVALLAGASGCRSLGGCSACHDGCAVGPAGAAHGHDGTHPRLAALRGHKPGGPGGPGGPMHGGRMAPDYGPASGAVAYPYYTNKGPGDFLEPNPPNIGR